LAAIINIPLSIENPFLANGVNMKETLNLLEASVKNNLRRFVYASTRAVYGEAEYLLIDEKRALFKRYNDICDACNVI
jgi:nucleoside-diphosphate-sugar epimerase